jgi:hypothetical protein
MHLESFCNSPGQKRSGLSDSGDVPQYALSPTEETHVVSNLRKP